MKPTKKSGDDSQSRSRPNEMMKTPALRKSKYYINARQDKTRQDLYSPVYIDFIQII